MLVISGAVSLTKIPTGVVCSKSEDLMEPRTQVDISQNLGPQNGHPCSKDGVLQGEKGGAEFGR